MDLKKEDKESHLIINTLFPTIINELVEKNNFEMLRKLENEIRHIHFDDFTKKNPLHIAAINGNLEIAKFLFKFNNININSPDSNDMTPLNYACLHKKTALAKFLHENGAILNEQNSMGSLFCKLAYEGDLENIKLFHQCGANLMITDYDKRTLAHIASAECDYEIMEFLVKETDYNLLVYDRWNKTPLDDCSEDIQLLLESKFGKEIK